MDSSGERTFLHLWARASPCGSRTSTARCSSRGEPFISQARSSWRSSTASPRRSCWRRRSRGALHEPRHGLGCDGSHGERVLPLLPHVDLFAPSLAEGCAITGEQEPAAVASWLRARASARSCSSAVTRCYASGEGYEGASRRSRSQRSTGREPAMPSSAGSLRPVGGLGARALHAVRERRRRARHDRDGRSRRCAGPRGDARARGLAEGR